MKKFGLLLCVLGLALVPASTSFARSWSESAIKTYYGQMFACGVTPSIALLYGVQPIVSNYDLNRSGAAIVHQTPFGWENYSISAGYIAGNGGSSTVSFDRPVTYGQDGCFYSTTSTNPLRPICLSGGTGPEWKYSACAPYALATADASGAIYMVQGNYVARTTASGWSPSYQLDLSVVDIAASCYGDIAVSGFDWNGRKSVAWFDYKSGDWIQRTLASSNYNQAKVDVEWDKWGNLGVAYSDSQYGYVQFDYMNMETGLWTSEIVNKEQRCNFLGAALAFDRFGNPVIACGNSLFYDPPSVPEPSSILALLAGVTGLACSGMKYRFKRR